MENATKALLIAAAVLIAVLLISLVMGVLNSGAEQIDNADLSEYEITQFNAKFDRYIGKNMNGSEVNAMLKTVFYHNNEQQDASTMVKVVDESTNKSGDGNLIKGSAAANTTVPTVSIGAKYNVFALYKDTLIKGLIITDTTATAATTTITQLEAIK